VIGLVVRLAILSQTGTLDTRIVDEQHYSTLAENLVQGNGFAWGPEQPTSIRPPLYPGMLAALWRVTGTRNYQAVRVLQILLGLATTFLVLQLGRLLYGETVGRYAAAAFWLYPSLIFFNFTVLTETLFTFLLLAFLVAMVQLIRKPSML